jgi:hypothetical protein
MNAVSSMHDRGAQLRDMANQLEMGGQPMFARERLQRGFIGAATTSDVHYTNLERGSADSLRAVRDTSINQQARMLSEYYGYDEDEVKGELRRGRAILPPSNAPEGYHIKQVRTPKEAKVAEYHSDILNLEEGLRVRTLSGKELDDFLAEKTRDIHNDEMAARAKIQQKRQQETEDRMRDIQAELDFFSPQEGLQKVSQMRNISGVASTSTRQLAQAVRTGTLAGLPPELLAAAMQAGAMPGSRGGGLRAGADGLMDVGTVRHQMETLARAGIVGAPAMQFLQGNVQRQQTLAEMGATTDFDRDAMMLSTMQKTGVPMQQAGGIMKDLTGMRMSALERFQAPGKKMLSSLLEASVYMRAGTVEEAGKILATESEAELIENAVRAGALPESALSFIGARMTPSNQNAGISFLRQMGDGATRGSAVAQGSTTIDPSEMLMSTLENREGFSALGASSDLVQKEAMTRFRMTLDTAAKHTIALADSLKALAASAGNNMFGR